jgi:hypothetical protein
MAKKCGKHFAIGRLVQLGTQQRAGLKGGREGIK